MGQFGKRNSERPAGGGDIFIKTFKNPRTLVWFLEDNPKDWVEYKQHFDNTAKRGWPCAIHEGGNDCVGCSFPVEDETDENDKGMRVRSTASRWVFPVIDEKGYVSLYQIGYKLWKALCELYEEYGNTLLDRQYAIRRTGETFNDIAYTPTRTDNSQKPEVKIAVPGPEYISQILGKQYLEAMERYGYEPGDGEFTGDTEGSTPDPEPVASTNPGDVAADAIAERKTAAAKKAAKKAPAKAAAKKDDGDEGQATLDVASSTGTAPNPDDMGLGELKDYLDNAKVEYPKMAGRPVLMGLVKRHLAESGSKSGWSDEPQF